MRDGGLGFPDKSRPVRCAQERLTPDDPEKRDQWLFEIAVGVSWLLGGTHGEDDMQTSRG